MQLDDELRKIFLSEVASYLEVLGDVDAGIKAQAEAAHGLKGAAGMLGFGEMQRLAGTLENTLREGDTAPRDRHLPRIRTLVEHIARGEDPPPEEEPAPAPAEAPSPTLRTPEPEPKPEPEPSAPPAAPASESVLADSGFDAETAAMLRSFFVEEAADHLSVMETELERLGDAPDNGDAIHAMFRAAHTLKGAAATVELHVISQAAHVLEDRLEQLRDVGGLPSPAARDRLVCCTDLLREMVDAVDDPQAAQSRLDEIRDILTDPLTTRPGAAAATGAPAPPRGAAPASEETAASEDATSDWDAETLAILLETFTDEAEDLFEQLDPLVEELAGGDTSAEMIDRLFRLAHTLKGSAGAVGLSALSKAAHLLEDELDVLRSRTPDAPPDLIDVVDSLREMLSDPQDSQAAGRLLDQVRAQLAEATGGDGADGSADAAERSAAVLVAPPPEPSGVTVERRATDDRRRGSRRTEDDRMIRVNAERLDALLSAVGEIVFRRTLIERRSEELTGLVRDLSASHQSLRAAVVALRDLRGAERHVQRFSELEIEFSDVLSNFDRAESGLREETEGLRRDAQYLQEGLTQMRLLSVRYLFARLRRAVRDIARTEGKQVVLQTQGEHTEIDKVVAEKIADPMIHIIRNAVAHGIESPAEREAAGKPTAGTVTIQANQEGNFVTLEVQDDGHGIDLGSIREALVEKGLMTNEEAESAAEAELTAAIFLPGLSTRRAADSVAGRGVGLDAVRDSISKLGGEVTVQSRRDEGTRFVVRMPLSTAVTNALLFKCANEVFCIPVRWVAETRTTKEIEVVRHRGRNTIEHRGERIPLLRLAQLLGAEDRVLGKHMPTIVLRHLDFDFALVVDKLIGPREIVLRKLGPLLEPLDLYAAATISGAGKVQLVLDVPTLHEWASAWRTLPRSAGRALPTIQRRVLVCDDSRSIREVVSRILAAEGYGVELANDGWDAWERLTGLRVDLLLTDLEMPRMDGYTLIEKVRREEAFRGLPILVLSSRTGEENQRRARRAGADGFLFKPVNRRVIVARIKELLGS